MFGLFKIGTINWKDAAQNLLIAIICFSTGSYSGFKASIKSNEATISLLIPTIEKAIDKETIANDITNKINLRIDKVKKSDSLNININQKPVNNQKPNNLVVKKEVEPEEDTRSAFGRFFNTKKKKKKK